MRVLCKNAVVAGSREWYLKPAADQRKQFVVKTNLTIVVPAILQAAVVERFALVVFPFRFKKAADLRTQREKCDGTQNGRGVELSVPYMFLYFPFEL